MWIQKLELRLVPLWRGELLQGRVGDSMRRREEEEEEEKKEEKEKQCYTKRGPNLEGGLGTKFWKNKDVNNGQIPPKVRSKTTSWCEKRRAT